MGEACFILATDLLPFDLTWPKAIAQAESLVEPVGRMFGFQPKVTLAALAPQAEEEAGARELGRVIDAEVAAGATELYVLPASLDLNILHKEALTQTIAAARRRNRGIDISHDEVDPCHPLLVSCFAQQVMAAISFDQVPPQRLGLLVSASGHGDQASRSNTYRMMRLLWEQLGIAQGEVGFLRHSTPSLRQAIDRCRHEPLDWIVMPQSQWTGPHVDYARTMLTDNQRVYPECSTWRFLEPPGADAVMGAWYQQRMLRLWQERRQREVPKAKSVNGNAQSCSIWTGQDWKPVVDYAGDISAGAIAMVPDNCGLQVLMRKLLPQDAERVVIKVSWHDYATGTYTDAAALDMLLASVPGMAIVVEGHTSKRNSGGVEFDWTTEARDHRAWIQQQDAAFLRKTGIADVLAKHGAQYLNITEAWWDERCASESEVKSALAAKGVKLEHDELLSYVPRVLFENRGIPFLSFGKFKGPNRLGISNLFGLLPQPLRTQWHGPDLRHFASICCDLAKLYGTLFPSFNIVEALYQAVRWDSNGMYQSRWGSYNLVSNASAVTVSKGFAGADILASRLQGDDACDSDFFHVVREMLGWSDAAEQMRLPVELQTRFA